MSELIASGQSPGRCEANDFPRPLLKSFGGLSPSRLARKVLQVFLPLWTTIRLERPELRKLADRWKESGEELDIRSAEPEKTIRLSSTVPF